MLRGLLDDGIKLLGDTLAQLEGVSNASLLLGQLNTWLGGLMIHGARYAEGAEVIPVDDPPIYPESVGWAHFHRGISLFQLGGRDEGCSAFEKAYAAFETQDDFAGM